MVERWLRCREARQHTLQPSMAKVKSLASTEDRKYKEHSSLRGWCSVRTPLTSKCPGFTGSSGSYQFTGFVTDLRSSSELLYTQSELPNPGLCVFLAHALSPWAGLSPHSYSPGLNQCLKYHSDPLLEARLQRTKRTLHYSNQACKEEEDVGIWRLSHGNTLNARFSAAEELHKLNLLSFLFIYCFQNNSHSHKNYTKIQSIQKSLKCSGKKT